MSRIPSALPRSVALGAALLGATPAAAAGNAHVIDDAEVAEPGTCQAEGWLTHFEADRGLVNLSPACTLRSLPFAEIGASIQYHWANEGSQTLAGPAVKLALRRVDRGVGFALGLSAGIDVETGRVETAAIVVPASVDISPRVRANFNLGYAWSRTGNRHAAFVGAQLEVRATETLAVMAEAFTRDGADPGVQAGLRWTPREWVDVDLLAARRVDGSPTTAMTIGLTLRR